MGYTPPVSTSTRTPCRSAPQRWRVWRWITYAEPREPSGGERAMAFDDLLVQVLALLQREQRLSYRALQRRFALEEADLEALKDELIYAKRLAVDEENRVLVWVGDTSTTPAPASQVPQPTTTHAD